MDACACVVVPFVRTCRVLVSRVVVFFIFFDSNLGDRNSLYPKVHQLLFSSGLPTSGVLVLSPRNLANRIQCAFYFAAVFQDEQSVCSAIAIQRSRKIAFTCLIFYC